MVRLSLDISLYYEISPPGCDFVFNIHAAHTRHQTVLEEKLVLSQDLRHSVYQDRTTGNRYLRMSAQSGSLSVRYQATVELNHHVALPNDIPEVNIATLPSSVLGYIYPSRYCESDRLYKLALREFGHLPQGYNRVLVIRDWVNRRVQYLPGSTTSSTSAVDTLLEEVGVCRDFAHLMIALCRALSIPARFATGTDYGADPWAGPPDFHAYVEVYLGDHWYIFDPTGSAIPMGFVRFGTGRDAADVSFATMFGTVQSGPPVITTASYQDPEKGWEFPYRRFEALSTDSERVDA